MIRLVLCGATGRMGNAIRALVLQGKGFIISYEASRSAPLTAFDGNADVVIDFSAPAALLEVLAFCVRRGLPLVIGTTGYNENASSEIEDAARHVAIIKSENFSSGAHVLGKLAKQAVQMLG